jgi:hypothetical protein
MSLRLFCTPINPMNQPIQLKTNTTFEPRQQAHSPVLVPVSYDSMVPIKTPVKTRPNHPEQQPIRFI